MTSCWLLLIAAFLGCSKVTTGIHPLISDDKIVRGSEVPDTLKTPHVVSVQIENTTSGAWFKFCGGSIVSPLFVVSACHCFAMSGDATGKLLLLTDFVPLSILRFVAGTAHLLNLAKSHQFRHPHSIRIHPKCQLALGDKPGLVNDFSLAKMAVAFSVNEYVKPLKMFSFVGEEFDHRLDRTLRAKPNCIAAGWGRTQKESLLSAFMGTNIPGHDSAVVTTEPPEDEDQLKIIHLRPMFEEECLDKLRQAFSSALGVVNESAVEFYGKLLRHQLCTLTERGYGSMCDGDSGSGLVCDGHLVGIASWSIACGTEAPDAFQSLPLVLYWFKEEVCLVESCSDARNLPDQCDASIAEHYLRKNCTLSGTTAKLLKIPGGGRLEEKQSKGKEEKPSGQQSSITPKVLSKGLITLTLLVAIKRNLDGD